MINSDDIQRDIKVDIQRNIESLPLIDPSKGMNVRVNTVMPKRRQKPVEEKRKLDE